MKSPSASVSSSTLCWYHTKFGKNAIKCKTPCSMSGKCFTWPVMATTGSGNENHLLFLNDCPSGQCYLFDSGAEVSVLPATSDCWEKRKVPLFKRQMTLTYQLTGPRLSPSTWEWTTNLFGPLWLKMSLSPS